MVLNVNLYFVKYTRSREVKLFLSSILQFLCKSLIFFSTPVNSRLWIKPYAMLLTVAVARNIIYFTWKGFRFSVFFTVLSARSKQFSSFCFLEFH